MKIQLKESGGFAGLARACEIETASLPAPEAKRVEELAAKVATSGEKTGPGAARDALAYELRIGDPSWGAVVRFSEASMSPAAAELTELLGKHLRVVKRA